MLPLAILSLQDVQMAEQSIAAIAEIVSTTCLNRKTVGYSKNNGS